MGKPTEDCKLVIRGRKISNADIDEVRTLIELQGKQGRTHISRRLAEQWQWKQVNGRLKDRTCRSILQELSQKGLIQLPVVKSSAPSKKDGCFSEKTQHSYQNIVQKCITRCVS